MEGEVSGVAAKEATYSQHGEVTGKRTWGTLCVFLFAVRDTKSPAIESGADVLAVQYWTDWIISAVAVLQNACGRVLSIPKMPQWTLSCPGCTKVFSHSQIDPSSRALPYDALWPHRPEFPTSGERIICPRCKGTATYQRFELVYSPE